MDEKNTVSLLFLRWDKLEIPSEVKAHFLVKLWSIGGTCARVRVRRECKLQSHEHSIFLMPTKIPRSRTILKNGWGWRTKVFRRTALFTNVTDVFFMYIHSCKNSRVVWQTSYGYRGNINQVNSNNLASLPH